MNARAFRGSPALEHWIAGARAANIVGIARQLQPQMRRVGTEWVGPCPSGCARDDGFAVTSRKGVVHLPTFRRRPATS